VASSDFFMTWIDDDGEVGSQDKRRASETCSLPRRVMALAVWCLLKASMSRPNWKLALAMEELRECKYL
jgi:hypothetical protein